MTTTTASSLRIIYCPACNRSTMLHGQSPWPGCCPRCATPNPRQGQ